jgi:7-cyano-7-deazaguanine synthase
MVSASNTPPLPDSVALVSGGLDSCTVLAIAKERGYRPLAVTFRYGQNHAIEIDRAQEITASLDLPAPLILDVPFQKIGGSALLGSTPIPAEPATGASSRPEIPSTYVPARNLVFLSLAVAVAEARNLRDIWIGVNALDYSGYPDCRPEFLASFLETAQLGTREGSSAGQEPWWRIQAPLVTLSKAEIIRTATDLGADLSLTISCYDPDPQGLACGICDSCGLRRRGFEEAKVKDPTRYQIRQ